MSGKSKNQTILSSYTGPCGDTIEFCIKLNGNRIESIVFSTNGCLPTRLCAMKVCEMVKDKELSEAMSIKAKDIIEAIGNLPKESWHCAELAETALKLGLKSLDFPLGEGNSKGSSLT